MPQLDANWMTVIKLTLLTIILGLCDGRVQAFQQNNPGVGSPGSNHQQSFEETAMAELNAIKRRSDFKDVTGMTFDRLIAIEFTRKRGTASFWRCKCECGNEKEVDGAALRGGRTRSCGCLHDENAKAVNRKHGLSKTPEYHAWNAMIGRCCNPNHQSFGNYGARGISVCDRWKESLENFVADMGPRPSAKHSIDRMNNDGNYEPGNCRWATTTQQRNNTRRTIRIEIGGVTRLLAEWLNIYGLKSATFFYRVRLGGMSYAEAITTPLHKSRWHR